MLYGEKGFANGHFFDEVDETRGFTSAHSRRRLIQQNHVRATGDGDANFKRPLLRVSKVHGQQIAFFIKANHGHVFFSQVVGILKARKKLEKCVFVTQAPKNRTP